MPLRSRARRTAAAFEAACLDELAALKPGNVHRWAPGHGMTLADFAASAAVAAPAVARARARVGTRVLAAVEATQATVGQNTNLGILLLTAPLARAAEGPGGLQCATAAVLGSLDWTDAERVFAAIRLANPGGLGSSPQHDVARPPAVPLAVAMAEAADRDRIAWNYVNGLGDIFERGLPLMAALHGRGWASNWTTTATYLGFLSAHPDSHVARKHGREVALRLRDAARPRFQILLDCSEPAKLEGEFLAWDTALKAAAINPGTSADLTVATLFAARLGQDRIPVAADGRLRVSPRGSGT